MSATGRGATPPRMVAPDLDLDLDEVFLDAAEAVVLTALEQIADDLDYRFRFFQWLPAIAEEVAVRGRLS
jgi:hypothetical protein